MSDSIRFNLPRKICTTVAAAAMLSLVLSLPASAQQEQEAENAPRQNNAGQNNAGQASSTTQNPEDLPPEKTDASAPEKDSAQDVMNNLMEQMKNNPMIEPTTPAGQGGTTGSTGSVPLPSTGAGAAGPGQTAGVRVDPNIVGTAPGAEPAKLRREGEFVISRKGRLVRSGDGMHTLFVFDADSKDSPEAPMAVVPCQMLQSMEDLMGQRGDQIQFILSGQILVYRGVNYVLPTMMTLAEDRGNLQ